MAARDPPRPGGVAAVLARPPGERLLLALAGVATLALYAGAALVFARALFALSADGPSLSTLVVAAVGVGLALGYAGYRAGTARLLAAVDVRAVDRREAPLLLDRLDRLADAVGIETPTLLVGRLGAPNALAIGGPRSGAVIVDASLFDLLDAAALEGVLAHELAHLEGRDSLVKTLGESVVRTTAGLCALALAPLALVLVGAVRGLALLGGVPAAERRRVTGLAWLLGTALAGLALVGLTLPLRAYSRRREFGADARAAALTGRPLALARGLAAIDRAATAAGPLASLYIDGGEPDRLSRLLATHPPMDERIARLCDRAARPTPPALAAYASGEPEAET